MGNKKFYFGTADQMAWVSAPAINMGINSVRWTSKSQFTNGGVSQRQSSASHKEYSLSWSPQKKEDIFQILSYFDGVYGDGPVYFLDPAAMDFNVLPGWFAAPFQAAKDGPPLLVSGRPALVDTSANALAYPTRSAQFTVGPMTPITIPVPSGYSLYIGAHGSATGAAVLNVSGTTAPLLRVTDTQRTNLTLPGGVLYDISFSGSGLITIAGIIAQVLPTGSVVPSGGFLPGIGNSGVALDGDPQITEYSAALTNASVGATANCMEVGGWL